MDIVVYITSILMWILCPALIGLILLQGAAGDISSAFGGGGQLDASLGVGAHRKMAQVTGVLAVTFFVMVLLMAYPHRDSFHDKKNVPGTLPVAVPAKVEAAKPVVAPVAQPEAAKPVVVPAQPEAAKPVVVPAQPVVVPAQPVVVPAQPEAAKPAVVPAQPEAAKPVEPVVVPATPVEPAKP